MTSGLSKLKAHVCNSLARYLEDRGIPRPNTLSVKSRCKPEYEKLEEIMLGQITKLGDNLKVRKKKLP